MLRYLAALFVVAVLLLAIRGFVRTRRPTPNPAPVAVWPWVIVPVAVGLVLAFGFALREWALGR